MTIWNAHARLEGKPALTFAKVTKADFSTQAGFLVFFVCENMVFEVWANSCLSLSANNTVSTDVAYWRPK